MAAQKILAVTAGTTIRLSLPAFLAHPPDPDHLPRWNSLPAFFVLTISTLVKEVLRSLLESGSNVHKMLVKIL
jgi:hypothetical protein